MPSPNRSLTERARALSQGVAAMVAGGLGGAAGLGGGGLAASAAGLAGGFAPSPAGGEGASEPPGFCSSAIGSPVKIQHLSSHSDKCQIAWRGLSSRSQAWRSLARLLSRELSRLFFRFPRGEEKPG